MAKSINSHTIDEQKRWVFQKPADFGYEHRRIGAIGNAMIEGQRKMLCNGRSREQLRSAGGRSAGILFTVPVIRDKDTDHEPEAPGRGREEAKNCQPRKAEELERVRHAHQQ